MPNTTARSVIVLPSAGSSPLRRSSLFSIDRKSTRLNSSHGYISYAVFCLKKKNLAIGSIDTASKRRLLLAGFFQAKVGEQFHVTRGRVAQLLRGSRSICARHVCHTVMGHLYVNVTVLVVGRRARRFRTTPPSARDVHEHTARPHFL